MRIRTTSQRWRDLGPCSARSARRLKASVPALTWNESQALAPDFAGLPLNRAIGPTYGGWREMRERGKYRAAGSSGNG